MESNVCQHCGSLNVGGDTCSGETVYIWPNGSWSYAEDFGDYDVVDFGHSDDYVTRKVPCHIGNQGDDAVAVWAETIAENI